MGLVILHHRLSTGSRGQQDFQPILRPATCVVDLARGIEVKINSVWFAFVALVTDLYRVADHGQFAEGEG
jgi:hypothetical protein